MATDENMFNFGMGAVPAHRHTYGGGWVADSAHVDAGAYVGPNAQVYGDAHVFGKAQVYGDAMVFGDAMVYETAWVSGSALVSGTAKVSGDAWVYGNALVSGDAEVHGDTNQDGTKITVPTIHSNGTSQEALADGYRVAGAAINEAIKALENIAPHGRDYYLQGEGAYQSASTEHRARVEKLTLVLWDLHHLHEMIEKS